MHLTDHLLVVVHDRSGVGADPAPGVEPRSVARQKVVVHAHVVANLVSNHLDDQERPRIRNYHLKKCYGANMVKQHLLE